MTAVAEALAAAREEGARDILGRQAAVLAQGQRDARLGGEQRVAAEEQEPQAVVGDGNVGVLARDALLRFEQ